MADTTTASALNARRLRIYLACTNCRRRKIRCDSTDGTPCARCARRGLACELVGDSSPQNSGPSLSYYSSHAYAPAQSYVVPPGYQPALYAFPPQLSAPPSNHLAQGSMTHQPICDVCRAYPCYCNDRSETPESSFAEISSTSYITPQDAPHGGEISSMLQLAVTPALLAADRFVDKEYHGEIEPGTFVIYSPYGEKSQLSGTQSGSFTENDANCIQAGVDVGKCLMSIHEPADAASWIEDNWDKPLVAFIRDHGYGGPIAWMLSPEESALAIFGSYDDPMVANMAKELADLSGFTAVVRPPDDNPALTGGTDHHNGYVQFNNVGGDNDDRVGDSEDEGESMPEDERSPAESTGNGGRRNNDFVAAEFDGDGLNAAVPETKPDGIGLGGGDGGGGEPTTVDGQWDSPLHRTRVTLQLKVSTAHIYPVTIGCNYRFTINRETETPIDLNDLTRPLSQPEVTALVDFEIETRPRETQVDRSYASIGFVAHREDSIIQRKFLHRGFELPEKLYKHGQQRQTQRGIQGGLGFSQGSALATTTFSYSRHKGTTLEATDSKVMPKCRVDYEPGDEWNDGYKSYSSYNIAYQLEDRKLDSERSERFRPMEFKVGMGINLQPAGSEKPLPRLSFVNRNQVLLWVSDPTSKARIRGIVVLMSNYFDNIRTQEKLAIFEQEQIELGRGSLKIPKSKKEKHKQGTISLSIAEVQNQCAPAPNKFRVAVPTFITKLRRRPTVASSTYIPPHEFLARGWDANNNEWRSVLWPALDKHFRAADLEGTSTVWKIERPWKNSQRTMETNIQLQEEGR